MNQRPASIYLVTIAGTDTARLIRAKSRHAAAAFVAAATITAERASQDQLIAAIAAGVQVENAEAGG